LAASDLGLYCGIVGWVALAVLCLFACLIARLFERRTGVRTRVQILAAASMVLVATGLVDCVGWRAEWTNITSAVLAASGVATAAAALRVYVLMVGDAR